MRTHQTLALLALGMMGTGCQSSRERGQGNPEISVIVTEGRVEVHAHQPGSCREVTAMPGTDACETFGWAVLGVETARLTDFCKPEPTCVSEVRLERGGEVIASAPGPSVGFYTHITGSDEHVVVSGCGEPMVIDLPPPLTGEVDVRVNVESDVIHVAAAGAGVESVLARAEGLISFPRSFRSACRSESGPVDLPTSPDFDSYVVNSLALAEPVLLYGGSVRLFPARDSDQVASKAIALGPVWQAAVALATQSPRHPDCESYCSAWQQSCQPSVDPDECTVLCVAEGSLWPSCGEEFDRYIQCQHAALACEEVLVVNYTEDPFAMSSSEPSSPCDAEADSYTACLDSTMR